MLIQHLQSAGRAEATLRKHAEKMQHLVAFWPTTELTAIGPAQLAAYVDAALAAGRSRHSIHMEIRTFRQAHTLAQHMGQADTGPAAMPDLGRYYVPRDRWLPQDEVRLLLQCLPERRREYVITYLQLGLRASELYVITAADCDWHREEVHVRGTKTPQSDRRLPLPQDTAEILRRRAQKRPQGALFETWTNALRDLREAAQLAGIAPVCLLDLRRTYATELLQAGESPKVVEDLMGHAPGSRMLMRVYAQVSGDARQAAVAKVPRYAVPDMCRTECHIVPLNAYQRRRRTQKNP